MIEHFEIDTLVLGAGVVGLAVARSLALSGKEVWLLERESEIGMQTSSRNSEVIHAGIYYPKNSLKAELCVKGKQQLYAYCEERHIPVNRCGKLIVATNESQVKTLNAISQQAKENGVDDIEWIDQASLSELEPDLEGLAALKSPSTGTIDSHAYMTQLQSDFEAAGGHLVLNSELRAVAVSSNCFEFEILGQNTRITAKRCVNSAGLQAIELFKDIDGFPQQKIPEAYFAKGSYFSYSGKVPFKHLIYPVPEPGGLGVHLTLDMAGAAKFGPDVEWLKDVQVAKDFDYLVDESKRGKFVSAIQSYWPKVDVSRLIPDYAGIRPKVSGPEDAAGDFLIQGPNEHGLDGLVNLFGIESPGLTASLAIGEYVSGEISS